jgi:proline iminopeptidase
MKKKILIGILLLLGLVVVAGVLLWYFMGKPLYEPGMVRGGKNLRASLTPPEQTGDADFWKVEEDISLFHFSDGTGKSVLVVHGGPGFPFHSPLPGLRPLSANYKFIYYDQRGCGKSTRPFDRFSSPNFFENAKVLDQTLGLGAQVADMERIRRIIGEEKVILLGHSFGAFLASLYAAEFPQHVEALILVAPANVLVMPAEGGGLFEDIRKLLPESLQQEYAGYLKRLLDYGNLFSKSEAELAALNAEFAKYYRAAAASRNLAIPAENEPGDNGGWMVHAMYVSMGRRHDYRAALKNVKAPVLVIHGEKDLQAENASRAYSDSFPHAQFQVIRNAGHFPFSEQPEEFASAVGKFLSGMNQE